jgi:hypothetical protein
MMRMVIGYCGYNVGILAVNILYVCICNLFNIHIATYVTLGQVNSICMMRIRLQSHFKV